MAPRHIAIIMDGNGRWAKAQGFLERTKGHERGGQTVRAITTHCANCGIEALTLYAFSTENWKRPQKEVAFLMKMLGNHLKNERVTLMNNGIRFRAIGDRSRLAPQLQEQIAKLEHETRSNPNMTQLLALNYGGRDEIVRAARTLCEKGDPITEEGLQSALDTASLPMVDMLIRTGGEQRVSNFLLFQSAYAELFFTPTLWPDFAPKELDDMIAEFGTRQRRFGGA